jgi:ribose transport system ATP-binding protein
LEDLLRAEKISKRFPGVLALDHVHLNVRKGEVHALLGENGAGKSTLVKILSGAEHPDEGSIWFKGETYKSLDPRQSIDLGIGVIYQEFNLVPHLSVAENIFLGNEPKKGLVIDDETMNKKANDLLVDLGICIDPKTRISNLSVAYQQMIEIAKSVSKNVELLIMDEPTAPLCTNEVDQLFEMIENLKKQGIGLVFISHRLEEVQQIANRVTVFRDGSYIDTVDVPAIDRKEMIALMVGREIGENYPEGSHAKDEVVLEVKNISNKNFRNISFSLHKGEILGIAGLVGAGRTEVGRAVFGADPLTSGTILLDGKEVDFRSPLHAIRHGIALLPEDRKLQGLLLRMSVRHNTSLSALKFISNNGIISKSKEEKLVSDYVKALGIKTPHLEQRVRNLSGGNQQKVVMAKWLATQSKVLIFDEPTRGIDVNTKHEIYELMKSLTSQGISIIMISSEMPELIGVADRILVMCAGEVKGTLNKKEATQHKILELATQFCIDEGICIDPEDDEYDEN